MVLILVELVSHDVNEWTSAEVRDKRMRNSVSVLPILREAAMPSNLSKACRSVLMAMNSTPETPVSIIRITAFPPPPPTPMTLITHGEMALLGSSDDDILTAPACPERDEFIRKAGKSIKHKKLCMQVPQQPDKFMSMLVGRMPIQSFKGGENFEVFALQDLAHGR